MSNRLALANAIAVSYRPDRDVVVAEPSNPKPPNLCSREGAEQLARDLDAWWHSRGCTTVKHWTEKATLKKDRSAKNSPTEGWVVRSNLIGGMPPPDPR